MPKAKALQENQSVKVQGSYTRSQIVFYSFTKKNEQVSTCRLDQRTNWPFLLKFHSYLMLKVRVAEGIPK